MSEGAKLENKSKFYVWTEDKALYPGSGSAPVLVNSGTLDKSNTTFADETEIAVNIENTGHIEAYASSGTLKLTDGGSSTGGTWSWVTLTSGSFSLTKDTVTTQIEIRGATVTAQELTGSEGELYVRAGSISVPTGKSDSIGTLFLETATLAGGGTFEITKELIWRGAGIMSGSGKTVLLPGASAQLGGGEASPEVQAERQFVNEGTMTDPTGGSELEMTDGSTLDNKATFVDNYEAELHGPSIFAGGGAAPVFDNTGTLEKSVAHYPTFETKIGVNLENYGREVQKEGTLTIQHPITKPHTDHFCKECEEGDPVNSATGDFSETQTDFEIGGRGVGLDLTRTYDAQTAATATSPGAFGYGWTNSFSDHLISEESGKKITAVQAEGGTVPFTESGKESFSAPTWSQDTLSGSSGTGYTLTLPEQTKYQFSGAGQLSGPNALATDSEGNVWVADAGHNRVQEFNSKGEFKLQFGATGTGNGQFTSMHGIAVSSTGNVYVAAASRIQEFNAKGEYLRQWGKTGTENGQFEGLRGVAIDPEGHVWTLETEGGPSYKPRLQEFSAEGTYTTKFEYTYGAENDQLKSPQALAIDSKGNFWVADTSNNRIQEFNSKGEFTRVVGKEGTENGQFKTPDGIAVDSSGNVWVADTGNDRIQELSSTGTYLSQFGKAGDNNGQFSEPKGVVVDTKGNVWVADTGNNRVQEATTGEYVRQFGGEGSGAGQLSGPNALATDSEGNVWVADAGHNRVQEFNSKGEFKLQFGATGTGNGQFTSMRGIAVSSAGNVYVAAASRVQEFNSKGEYLRQWGKTGTENGQFEGLRGVAIDPEGHVWTLETEGGTSYKPRLQEFSAEGTYTTKFEYTYGAENDQLKSPQALAIDSKGNFWVADTSNNRIQEFNSKGEFTRVVGKEGTENGQFKTPDGIAVDSSGNVWVADTGNDRIQELSSTGTYLSQFGKAGDNNGQFSEPKGVVVDTKGNVWVADTGNNRVQEATTGEYVRQFGGEGSGAGQLSGPNALATDSEGNVWVADAGHNRVQEFNSKGEFKLQFGATGTGNGQFTSMRGIAVSSAGNVYVAAASRVQEFNSKGEYLRQWGKTGTENGQFEGLRGVAIDPEGHVWTLETEGGTSYKPRLQEFSAEGTYTTKFEYTYGAENDQLKSPQALAIDSKGNFWVADTSNNRIQEFNSKGEFTRVVGKEGTENGQFKTPDGIAVDSSGNVWVADTGNDRIQELSSTGTYLSQFGKAGDNNGQFSEPKGVVVDTKGNVWVADTGNNRVQEWAVAGYAFTYSTSFGTTGSAGGQFSHPADVAIDSKGNLWVADKTNNRVQEFNEKGEFVLTFGKEVNKTKVEAKGTEAEQNLCTAASGNTCQAGKAGSANGQLSAPAALAIDSKGNLWIADKGNNRVEELNEKGEYVSKFGSVGTGNGQFTSGGPEGLAIDSHNNIWVSDTYAGRVEEFNEKGEFIRVVGSKGSGSGQLGEPTGISIGPGGNAWIADWLNNRVAEFNEKGEFVRQFGAEGAGNGKFERPDAINVDTKGDVWVGDQNNDRIQEFNEKGEYRTQFGSKGSGAGQFSFSYPLGLAVDSKGDIWVADTNNNRVQKWTPPSGEPPLEAPVEPDPKVKVNTSSGLVSSVEGEAAGKSTYQHSGESLTTAATPKGETKYKYNEAKQLTKVELPHGTWGEIAYDSTGRVKSVTVSIEGGKAKTTSFTYSEEPRRTVVTPESEPAVTYEIGVDGSVLKWWNAAKPPEIEELTGSLWVQRGEVHPEPISSGDQTLSVVAHSPEGISSIQIVANGSHLVEEKKCEESKCLKLEKELVTETESWPPGVLQLEVIVTDRLGQVSTERLWDNIPYTPPQSESEELEPPTFAKIKTFREEFGLDLDLKGNEQAINERIFNLIADWHNPNTPEGEVARTSDERWGVPLRAVDVAELEYRERYIAQAATAILQWVTAHGLAGSYAGYYVNYRQGGIIHVGFTSNQASLVEQLEAEGGLMAPARIAPFEVQPKYSLASLAVQSHEFSVGLASKPEISALMTGKGTDVAGNRITVETSNVNALQSYISENLNPALFTVEYQPERPSRERAAEYGPPHRVREADQRLFAGDAVYGQGDESENACTLNFGANEKTGTKKSNGEYLWERFALTAGHCFQQGATVFRYAKEKGKDVEFAIGQLTRRAYGVPVEGYATDAEAIHLKDGFGTPEWIWVSSGYAQKTASPSVPYAGELACNSGIEGGTACGQITGLKEEYFLHSAYPEWVWEIVGLHTIPGDSGGPVWDLRTGAALGTWTGGHKLFTPVLGSPAEEDGVVVGHAVGILHAPGMGNLQIKAVP